MDDKEIEVNGRTFEIEYLKKAIEICRKHFIFFKYSSRNLNFLSQVCGLKEDELNKLVKHLDEMRDILLEYHTDLYMAKTLNDA